MTTRRRTYTQEFKIEAVRLLTEVEWKAAWQVRRRTTPPETPPPLGEMIKIISSLGG